MRHSDNNKTKKNKHTFESLFTWHQMSILRKKPAYIGIYTQINVKTNRNKWKETKHDNNMNNNFLSIEYAVVLLSINIIINYLIVYFCFAVTVYSIHLVGI